MDTEKKTIVVPFDFTNEAACAVEHAISTAKVTGHEVCLVHIIDDNTRDRLKKEKKDVDYIHQQLKDEVEKIRERGVNASYVARAGSIFTTIGEIADELQASLMIFGTHGVRGMQKIFGAHAIKVAVTSKAPVVIVQRRNPGPHGYKKIVMPVDNNVFTKQKAIQGANLAKHFGAEVHLYPKFLSDPFLSQHVQNNLAYMKSELSGEGIVCHEVELSAKKQGSFPEQIIAYAKSIDADMIAIVVEGEKDIWDFSNEDVTIINNDYEIPTLCVNPKNTMVLGRIISFGGFG